MGKRVYAILVFVVFGLCHGPCATAQEAATAHDFQRKGQALYEAGKYEEAFEAFTRFAQLAPDFWWCYNRMGWTQLKRKNYRAAMGFFKKADSLRQSAGTYAGWGEACYALKKNSQALALFKQYVQLRPDDWYGYNRLGWTLFWMDAFPESARQFAHAVALKKLPGNYEGLGRAFDRMEEYESALDCFSRQTALAPENWYPVNRMGWIYFSLGQYKRAIEHFQRANTLSEQWGNYEGLARSYLAMGRCDQARAIAAAGKERDENERSAHDWDHILACCAAASGDLGKAYGLLGKNTFLGIEGRKSPLGFRVLHVYEGTPASVAGLASGDILVEFDGRPLKNKTFPDVKKVVRLEASCGETVPVLIQRGSRVLTMRLTAGIAAPPVPENSLSCFGALRENSACSAYACPPKPPAQGYTTTESFVKKRRSRP